ncbi:hypothetical protein ACIGO9_31345 [Nocardia asteroides]|uniref:hypothetical protein n=1 Tax=Nocardia asteroides TaxID=1824 RepID=UPI0037C7CB41
MYYLVSDLRDPPPSTYEVEAVLDILRMPHGHYRPGEDAKVVLERIREMLTAAERRPAVQP